MRSLFYMADRNKLLDLEKWDIERPYPEPSDEELRRDEFLEACGSRELPARTEEDLMAMWREARPQDSDCRASYEVFKTLCHDQADSERQGYDRDCLRALFQGCPKLREVAVVSQRSCMRQLDANRVFAKAMTEPSGDRHWWDQSVHQALSVAMAADQSGTKLDSLTLVGISPGISGDGLNPDQWRALKNLAQPLRRLRLYLGGEPPEEEDEDEPDEGEPDHEQLFHQFNDSLSTPAHEILSAASNLRILKLQLPKWLYHDYVEDTYGQLEPILRDVTYPHLYELHLSHCEVHADYLVDLCLRHKAALRRLSLKKYCYSMIAAVSAMSSPDSAANCQSYAKSTSSAPSMGTRVRQASSDSRARVDI